VSDFRAGVRAIAPLVLAAIPFGMILGAAALRQGLTGPEVVLMSATVFAGGAQFMAVGLWHHPAPWLALGFAVLLVNLRHVLMAASLVRKMGRFTPWQRWLGAFVLTDEGWATCERHAVSAPLTPAYYAGAGLAMYVVWIASTAAGTVLGQYVPKPEALGLDFAFPAVFLCLVKGFARDWRAAPVIAASALTALIVHHFVGGTWFVIAGGLAGMAAAVALPPLPERSGA
jgi:4-azaleucine resistance transporter AzlC